MSGFGVYLRGAQSCSVARTPLASRFAIVALGVAVALTVGQEASAQVAPDAGRLLSESAAPRTPVEHSTIIQIHKDAIEELPAGGERVRIVDVGVRGATRFEEKTLVALLGDVAAQSYDLAGLRGLADQIMQFYHEHGYPFARAYLPPQEIAADGRLVIEVIEGRYCEVLPAGDRPLQAGATNFLRHLRPGTLIEARSLERTLLILDDQPGVSVTPVLRPGARVGDGDLEAHVAKTERIQGTLSLDNHGNRYVGSRRLQGAVTVNRPFLFGDQFAVEAIYTDEELWFGRARYQLPLGTSGLRGEVSYSQTDYQLGKDFAILGQTGEAKISAAGLSYPLVRSQLAKVVLSGAFRYKQLRDERSLIETRETKSSRSVPIALDFDRRDALGGGGLTFGTLSWTPGRLDLDAGLTATDHLETRGRYHKLNLDLARVQYLARGFSVFGRISGQWADRNLDSSEGFSLGGAYGVRAYPQGEGFGDEGWLGQAELRYARGGHIFYLFHDAGKAYVNAKPLDPSDDLRRSISSAGIGVRLNMRGWNIHASSAWRTHGGTPESDSRDTNPMLWLSTSYAY